MTHQTQIQKPAQASSKARFNSQKPKAEMQQKALENAVSGESLANYQAIFDGFAAMGIDMADVIPFGQPILVGHHSETRDRNYRNRIHNTFGKAFAAQDKAAHYAQKAASVGTGGISSDDPDAIKKLRAELASAEKSQELMKAANKAIRGNKTPETQVAALVALGLTEAQAAEAVKPDFCGRVGFPGYALSNNNANMTRIKGRIAELEKRCQRADVERAGDGFTYREDTTENRVLFVFDGKPDEATRAILKREAFKWSPSRGAWVRQLNNAGIWAGKQVLERLNVAKIGEVQ